MAVEVQKKLRGVDEDALRELLYSSAPSERHGCQGESPWWSRLNTSAGYGDRINVSSYSRRHWQRSTSVKTGDCQQLSDVLEVKICQKSCLPGDMR